MDYNFYMAKALEEAQLAKNMLETPIGSIIVHEDKIIASAFNQRNTKKSVLYHAEIIAISKACEYMGDWRLEGCTIFVTLEPCPMCIGAILQARMDKLVYGAKSPKAGSVGSILNVLDNERYNHKVEVVSGIMEKECGEIISNFFAELRKN